MSDSRAERTAAEAKFLRPRLEGATLRRGARTVFKTAFARRLVIVRAPAGYGKSTTVATAQRLCGMTDAWYRLDLLDRDPLVFFAGMLRALQRTQPGLGSALLDELEHAPAQDLPVEALAARLAVVLEHLDGPRHLILDDFHEASESPELERALAYLLQNSPSCLHFVVLTRFEPPLVLSKLHLDGGVTRMGNDLLRFDGRQVADVVRQLSGHKPDRRQIDRLLDLTEGWPASVVLAGMALSWTDADGLEAALGDPRLQTDVYSYLAEQVYDREAPGVRRFLDLTCCLENVTVGLAERLAGEDARVHLRRLTENHILTSEADTPGAYRYHNLLRDYLRQRCILEEGEAAYRRLQRRTAVVLEDTGDRRRAVELLLDARCPQEALAVIARGGEPGIDVCPSSDLQRWLDTVRAALGDDVAWTLILSGVLGTRNGRFAAAFDDLRGAAALLRAAGDDAGLYQALSITESAEFWAGDAETCMATCEAALRLAPTKAQQAHTLLSLISAAVDLRRWDIVERQSKRVEDVLPFAQEDERGRARALRAHAAIYQGQMRHAKDLIRDCDFDAQPMSRKAAMLNTAGMIDMALGDYDAAARRFGAAEAASEEYGHALTNYMISDSRACLATAQGRFGPALRAFEALRSDPGYVREPSLLAFSLCHEGTAMRRAGLVEECLEPGRTALEVSPAGRDPYLTLNATANVAFAEGLLGADRTSRLATLSADAASAGLRFVEHKAQLYAAVLMQLAGDRSDARELLEFCLPLQFELGHLHFVAQELTPRPDIAIALLRRSRSSRLGPHLIRAMSCHWRFEEIAGVLRAECPSEVGTWITAVTNSRTDRPDAMPALPTGQSSPATSDLSALTPRELDLLRLIADGLSNKAIADSLYLAVSTVKTHETHIYRKLGVKTRLEAALRYRQAMDADRD